MLLTTSLITKTESARKETHLIPSQHRFYNQLKQILLDLPKSYGVYGHVGSTRVDFDGVYGGFRYGSRNQEGEGILNCALAYDLIVANTLFRKRVSHLVTFSNGQHCSQIDFILARREDRHACLDCKVIPGVCRTST
jgi:hypothetical protein